MPSHDSKKSKLVRITVNSNEVVLYTHPNIIKIYHCYALILSASSPPIPTKFHLDVCASDTPHQFIVFNNLSLLHYSQTQPVQLKLFLKDIKELDWNKIKYQLSIELIQYMQQLKIDIGKIDPKQFLKLLNQHLSRQAIYDFTIRIYEKPHAQLSFQTLAFLLSCSRNQLIYRQHQIDRAYKDKCTELGQKCFALNLQKFNTKIFWEI